MPKLGVHHGEILQRNWVILSVLLLTASIFVSACGKGSGSADAATAASLNFVTAYYQENSAKNALIFCTGEAKQKLSQEVKAIEDSGVSPDSASQRPEISVENAGFKRIDNNTYVVSWRLASSAGQKLNLSTTMTKPEGGAAHWLVSKFEEQQE